MRPTDILGSIKLYNADCMEVMKTFKDKQFSLAIVDPPYFDGPQKQGYYRGTKQRARVGNYKKLNNWNPVSDSFVQELKRVSINQIIWGVNYFDVSLPGGRVVWVKGVENSPFSMCDIAYQSFYNRIDLFKYLWSGYWQENMKNKEERIHPTQKPVQLYKWLLQNYAKEGDTILDTHSGSLSIGIACHDMKFDLTAIELDKDYYEQAKQRLINHQRQLILF